MQTIVRGVWVIGALCVSACGVPSGPGELVEREDRAHQAAAAVIPGASPELRYWGQVPKEERQQQDESATIAEQMASLLDYDLPEGWELLPPTRIRIVNLRPAGNPDIDCYVSVLPSDGGGVAANVDRWRDQVGLPPATPDQLAALPERTLLRASGVLVDVEGTFTPMGGSPHEGWRLVGVIAPIPGQTLFLKMTGPVEAIEAELESFEAFCASIRASDRVEQLVEGREGSPETTAAAGLTWTPPEGWVRGPERNMRIVTYNLGSETECYLSLARGDQLTNYNRWRGQVGLPPMKAQDIAELETVEVLGEPRPVLEVTGEFRGMTGGSRSNTTLLGLMCPLAGDSLFVKMVGPAAEVAAARADFDAFCASITTE